MITLNLNQPGFHHLSQASCQHLNLHQSLHQVQHQVQHQIRHQDQHPTPDPTITPTAATAIKVEFEQKFVGGADPTDFNQFVSAPINATSLDTTAGFKNPVILDTVFKEKLLQIIADSLTNSGAIQSASKLTITAVYLVWVPARRLVSNTDNRRSLQSGSWEVVIEYEVIVDTVVTANQAVTTV